MRQRKTLFAVADRIVRQMRLIEVNWAKGTETAEHLHALLVRTGFTSSARFRQGLDDVSLGLVATAWITVVKQLPMAAEQILVLVAFAFVCIHDSVYRTVTHRYQIWDSITGTIHMTIRYRQRKENIYQNALILCMKSYSTVT